MIKRLSGARYLTKHHVGFTLARALSGRFWLSKIAALLMVLYNFISNMTRSKDWFGEELKILVKLPKINSRLFQICIPESYVLSYLDHPSIFLTNLGLLSSNSGRASNLDSGTKSKTNTTATEERSRGTRLDAQVKVDIGAVLVGASETALSAERVAVSRAKVGDLDDDAVAGIRQSVAAAIGLGGELIALAACRACTSAGANAKEVLACGDVEAGCEEAAGGGGGLAVGAAVVVAGAVFSEGGFEDGSAG